MLYLSDNQLSGTLTPYVLPDGLQVSSQSPADLGARRAHRVPRRRPCTGSACRQGPYTGPEGSPRHTGRCGRQGFGWPAYRTVRVRVARRPAPPLLQNLLVQGNRFEGPLPAWLPRGLASVNLARNQVCAGAGGRAGREQADCRVG